MITFREALDKLKKSAVFKKWYKENKNSYLSYCFIMQDPNVKEEWQVGYYHPDSEKATVFSVGNKIVKNPDAELFKKDGSKVLKLDLEKVKTTLEDVLEAAKKLQKEKYSAHIPVKTIIILQNLELGQIWNITFMTLSFKTLNVKIDAATGKILKHELIDLFRVEK